MEITSPAVARLVGLFLRVDMAIQEIGFSSQILKTSLALAPD